MFFIKQVANDLGITPQAIYKQKEELQSKGYMIRNSSNDWEITSDGYNYLKEKQHSLLEVASLVKLNSEKDKKEMDFKLMHKKVDRLLDRAAKFHEQEFKNIESLISFLKISGKNWRRN